MTLPLAVQLLVAGLSNGSIYALVALGLILAFKGTGVLNFAHGELVALGAYLGLYLSVWGLPYWQVVVVAVLVAGVFGAVLERGVLRPLMSAPLFTVVVATVAISLVIKNALRLSWQTSIASFPTPLDGIVLRYGGVTISPHYLWIIGCSVVIMGGLALFFRTTLVGKAMQAVAQNPVAARLMGIRVNRIFSLTLAVSAGIAALAGILIAPLIGIHADMGGILIKGFVAAILGGFTSLIGCVVGGLILGIVEAFGGAIFGGLFKDLAAFGMLMIVLLLRPHGLFGSLGASRV